MSSVARRIFVGNLPWTIGNRELKLHFSRFGNVQQANVVFDKATGLSKGYAFLVYSTNDGLNNALNAKKQQLYCEGRNLNVERATN
jgi:RNA recognition motif-containing protein